MQQRWIVIKISKFHY